MFARRSESATRGGGATPERPDLVLVMTDQQRFDQVGYASSGHFETPAIDALAARGVVFETAYSAATTCVPARVALLTGLHPHRAPAQENGVALREGFWTVAHELRSAGYETALFGKMHFAPVHAAHGFETMRLCEHLAWQGLGPESRARGDVMDDYHEWLLGTGLDDWRLTDNGPMPQAYPASAHSTEWIEREASAFLERRDRGRPLFLVVSFPHPHAPYDPPEPYRSMYDPADSVLPTETYAVNEGLPLAFQLATSRSRTREEAADPRRVRRFLASVRGLVRQVDDAVGRLVAHIDLDRTVLFFTSDHGDYSGHRGLMRKNPWITFDDLARVALFATGAGVAAGGRIPAPVQSCDFALTCLDYAGVAPPPVTWSTRSLRPMLERGAATDDAGERSVLCGTAHVGWPMIRKGRHKYIEHAEHPQAVLFDLEADPCERVNRVDDPAARDTVEELAATLHAVRNEPVLDLPAPAPDASP